MFRFTCLIQSLASLLLVSLVSCQSEADEGQSREQEAFADMASDPSFRAQHAEPGVYALAEDPFQPISYDTPDGQTARGLLLPAKTESNDYLFVIHEWWGLNDYVKEEAIRYQDTLAGRVNVVCLDLYAGKVAEERAEAQQLMQSVEPSRARAIIEGAIAHAGPEARIATLGWCFGGGWSLEASLLAEEQAAGCVMYYGMPVQDTERLAELQTKVLGIFAEQDEWITPQVVDAFEKNMAAVNQDVRVEMFDADHAFANPSSPRHVEAAAQQAFLIASGFLQQAFDLN